TGSARLEVFTEKVGKHPPAKGARAVYLVFTTDFADGDQLQWSAYLKDKNVSLQLYASEDAGERHDLDRMAEDLAKRLRKQGFLLSAPVVRLKKPFRVPEGFRLNVRA
ncbi:MAG TPA: hypothetical protein VFR02_07665, partial [bacterium]|nr:hypothetical protein [bacterium]